MSDTRNCCRCRERAISYQDLRLCQECFGAVVAEAGWELERRELTEDLCQIKTQRDEERLAARLLWEFVAMGGFGEDLEMGEVDTPEWHLWVLWQAAGDVAYRCPWIKEEGE